uniref:RING-type E3 ubiquitin transferase n=1 Tax=Leersia perrieri TaxID=77586 RepID=A0A0D9VWX3_9ORYZ
MFGFDFGGMDDEAAAHIEIVALVVLGAIVVAVAAVLSGACRRGGDALSRATRSVRVVDDDDDDVERALGEATRMTYEQAAAAAKKKRAAAAGEEEEDTCAICWSEYDAGAGEATVRVVRCGHFYHADCVDRWLKDNRHCPLCRGGLSSPLPSLPNPACPPLPPRTNTRLAAVVY